MLSFSRERIRNSSSSVFFFLEHYYSITLTPYLISPEVQNSTISDIHTLDLPTDEVKSSKARKKNKERKDCFSHQKPLIYLNTIKDMCDIDNIWDEASKMVVAGTEELDDDDVMSILDSIPLEGLDGDGTTLLEDQWFMSTSPHCFGPIPSNMLFFEPFPDRTNGSKPAFSSPVPTPPAENRLMMDGTPEEKPHACVPQANTACNNPRKNVRARSKRAKPSGPTKWHFFTGIDSTFKKDITKRVSVSSPSVTTAATKTCTHCKVTKTPQWREGPDGPKTLCNACGVRYRTGRLFPEYRPAASPTFRPSLHSNSHKKVIEMRKDKDQAMKI